MRTASVQHQLTIFLLWLIAGSAAIAAESLRAQHTIAEIRREASMEYSTSARPLPLFSSWNTGELGRGFTPKRQMDLIRQGHRILPTFHLPPPNHAVNESYFAGTISFIADNKLPLTLVSTQWEGIFFNQPNAWKTEPPLIISVDSDKHVLNPWTEPTAWTAAGEQWGSSDTLNYLQKKLINPAKIVFLSNNEASKPRWSDVIATKKLVSNITASQLTPARISMTLNNRWQTLYSSLIGGIRSKLTNSNWKNSAAFIGFDALVPSEIGRYYDWNKYLLLDESALQMWPRLWDGASVPYYLNDWDGSTFYSVWSPQIEAMNYVPALKNAYAAKPNYWLEMSVWDGHIAKSSKDKLRFFVSQRRELTGCRYAGFVKFGMWLLTPRVVREFRFYSEGHEEQAYAAEAIMEAVDELYENTELEQFWRRSTLLVSDGDQHPYDKMLPDSYRNAERWFLLSASANAQPLNSLSTEIKTFALARKMIEQKTTRYLVYAFSPFLKDGLVTIEVPGLGKRDVNTSACGAYTILNDEPSSAPPEAPKGMRAL